MKKTLWVLFVLVVLGFFGVSFYLQKRASPFLTKENEIPAESMNQKNKEKDSPPEKQSPSFTKNIAEDLSKDYGQEKVMLLREILASKNDNDPRLDTEFKSLSTQTKILMKKEYKSMKPENFNEKGTIVFLLGHNLTDQDDFNFLSQVLSEPPCLSLKDCSHLPEQGDQEDSFNRITLVYPQIVSLKAIENYLSANSGDPALRKRAAEILKQATQSASSTVSQEARSFVRRSKGLDN